MNSFKGKVTYNVTINACAMSFNYIKKKIKDASSKVNIMIFLCHCLEKKEKNAGNVIESHGKVEEISQRLDAMS